ncbi:MAG: MBL fold metallo-hydrolase [Candidatus Eisenbacteria bacterium]|nr:MBL fold metallo-hydrolase [Candidatus Eisenbacteria bacterium]
MRRGSLTVLGARGSNPTPGAAFAKYGGHTTSLALPLRETTLLIDAGTGVVPFGARLLGSPEAPRRVDWVFTHFHLDHVVGLPAFAPLYREEFRVSVYLPAERMEDGRRALERIASPPYYPVGWDRMEARITFHPLPERLEIEDVAITHAPLRHPGGALAYRLDGPVGSAVLATDTEHPESGIDEGLLALCSGAGVILYDAQYDAFEYEAHRGWGHSTWEAGARLAEGAGARRLVLVHHNPEREDGGMDRLVQEARRRFAGAEAAREGMTIPVARS